jgi:glycogen debranching enzyme
MSSPTEKSTKRILPPDSIENSVVVPSLTTTQQTVVEGPTLRPQHNIRRAEILPEEYCFHSRLFYIRQSDERVDLGEIINFKSEFEANFELNEISGQESTTKQKKTLESIFGTKKFYLEIQMRFKEASLEEIECQDKLKMKFSLEEANNNFQTVSTVKLLLRNSSR